MLRARSGAQTKTAAAARATAVDFAVDAATALEEKPDCSVICTDHTAFDYHALVNSGTLVIDTRNALKGNPARTIFRL